MFALYITEKPLDVLKKDYYIHVGMDDIPIYSPTKLTILKFPMRRNDVPVQLIDWKIAHLVFNAIIGIIMLIFTSNYYALIVLLQIIQFFVQIINMRTGPWGNPNGWLYCDVDVMVKSGQNTVRLAATAITEAIVVAVVQGRFASVAILFLYRLDGIRRACELGKPTEQSTMARDLESLHAAQPVKDPVIGIDIVLPIIYCLLWYNKPILLIHFGVRAGAILCRDFSIISPIQEELYGDIITSISLNVVVFYLILSY